MTAALQSPTITTPDQSQTAETAEQIAARLEATHGGADAQDIIRAALDEFGDDFAFVSSFGSQSAVLLHIASQIDVNVPVVFLDTGKLFGETKRHRDALIYLLGLTNVITKTPDADEVLKHDPKGLLWNQNNSACCFVRKVVPLRDAMKAYRAWGSGRKRYQNATRETLPHFEASDGKVKVNPLASWSSADIAAYAKEHDLPAHPLVAEGFASIGCMPCTDRVADGEDERAGRWRGAAKSECGIHLSFAENAKLASYQSSGL